MNTFAELKAYQQATECYSNGSGWHHKFTSPSPGDDDRCLCGRSTHGALARAGARKWNRGVRAGAILDYIADLSSIGVSSTGQQPDWMVRRVATDETAGPEDIAWVSGRAISASEGARVAHCRAGILVLPIAGVPYLAEGTVGLVAPDPKALMADLVGRFFPDDQPNWPDPDSLIQRPVTGARARFAPGVIIGKDVIIGDDVEIGPYTCLANVTIGNRVRIGAHCAIGLEGFGFVTSQSPPQRFPHTGRVVIGDDVEIGSQTCIDRGTIGDTMIRDGAKIDNLVHIAHNVVVGPGALVIAGACLCGSATVGARAWIAPQAVVREGLHVGANAVVGLGAVVVKEVPTGATVIGNPAKPMREAR